MLSILEWNAKFAFDKSQNPLTKVAAKIGTIRQEDMPQLELVIQVLGKATSIMIYIYGEEGCQNCCNDFLIKPFLIIRPLGARKSVKVVEMCHFKHGHYGRSSLYNQNRSAKIQLF